MSVRTQPLTADERTLAERLASSRMFEYVGGAALSGAAVGIAFLGAARYRAAMPQMFALCAALAGIWLAFAVLAAFKWARLRADLREGLIASVPARVAAKRVRKHHGGRGGPAYTLPRSRLVLGVVRTDAAAGRTEA